MISLIDDRGYLTPLEGETVRVRFSFYGTTELGFGKIIPSTEQDGDYYLSIDGEKPFWFMDQSDINPEAKITEVVIEPASWTNWMGVRKGYHIRFEEDGEKAWDVFYSPETK